MDGELRRSPAALVGGVLTALGGLFLLAYYGGLFAWAMSGRATSDYLWMDGSDQSRFAGTFFAGIFVAYGVALLVLGIHAARSRRGAVVAALVLGFLAMFASLLSLAVEGGVRTLVLSCVTVVANVLLAVALIRGVGHPAPPDDLEPLV